MQTKAIIILARMHRDEGADDSARACLSDSVEQYDAGNDEAARMWAIKSLAYSIGTFHPLYRKAAR
jgi:hypothetical protein